MLMQKHVKSNTHGACLVQFFFHSFTPIFFFSKFVPLSTQNFAAADHWRKWNARKYGTAPSPSFSAAPEKSTTSGYPASTLGSLFVSFVTLTWKHIRWSLRRLLTIVRWIRIRRRRLLRRVLREIRMSSRLLNGGRYHAFIRPRRAGICVGSGRRRILILERLHAQRAKIS